MLAFKRIARVVLGFRNHGTEAIDSQWIPTRVFVACVLCLVAGPTHAAPTLLVEFRHNITTVELGTPPPTVLFDFDAYNSITGLDFLSWEDAYDPTDVGMTFVAPHDVVEDANLSIVLPNTLFGLTTGPANFSDPLRLPTFPFVCPECSVQTFVSDLTRHTVTSVERTIDQLQQIDRQDRFYGLSAAQRIRFWGEPIPEPSAISLSFLGIGACAIVTACSRKRTVLFARAK